MGGSDLSCGAKCSRITLAALNVIFLVCGIAFIVLGAIFRFGNDKLKSEVETSLSEVEIGDYNLYSLATNLAVIFMAAGGVMVLFSFLGFIGSCCLSRCALVLYAVLVGLVLCLQIAGVALFFIMRAEFEEGVQTGLKKSIDLANHSTDKDVKDSNQNSLEYLFVEMNCCQVNGSRLDDYGTAASVCGTSMNPGNDYNKDCYQALKDWIQHYQIAFIAIGIAVIVVEILLIICACVVFKGAGKKSRYG